MARKRNTKAVGPPKTAPLQNGLDDLDLRLLGMLQRNSRESTAELARHFRLSAPGLHKRLRRLERSGVIREFTTVIRREAVGLDLLCFVLVMLAHHSPGSVKRFREGIVGMPEVLECHYLTGEFDCVMKVVVRNHAELQRFVERVIQVGGVDRLRTSIVLDELKSSTALPL